MTSIKTLYLAWITASLMMVSSPGCQPPADKTAQSREYRSPSAGVTLVVLGTFQDGGSPHAGCTKPCCAPLFDQPDPERMVVSLGIVDHLDQKTWLFEATPDLPRQMKLLKKHAGEPAAETPDGIFLTHAHIGHYSGLMHLGREAMNSREVPVYALPRMTSFLQHNGPWSQLVSLRNITLVTVDAGQEITLADHLTVIPLTVPHRDEFSETAGFIIRGPEKRVLFIPDIDKWEKWDHDIVELIGGVDYALLDATFFDGEEIANRDIREIPHPFVVESMALFGHLPDDERGKIHFIHLNHTNPLADPGSRQTQLVTEKGFRIARLNQLLPL